MNKEILKEVLSIPSVSGREELVREYLQTYAEKNGIVYYIDGKGNIYLTKGKVLDGEYYPCVISHMDTVHRPQIDLINKNERLKIVESVYEIDDNTSQTTLTARMPNSDIKAGIGGDDKCGVFVCLEMLEYFDNIKAAFFVEEEIGMRGSKEADKLWFSNVGYAIQFDAPSDNWITEVCSGVKLFDNDFKGLIKETLSDGGYTSFSNDPFTDVNQLAQKFDFCCLNLGCGYHRQHSVEEYVVVEEVENSVKVGIKVIEYLGNKFYEHKKNVPLIKESKTEWGYENRTYPNTTSVHYDWDQDDDITLMSENITDSVIEMLSEGATREDILDFVYDYLEDNFYY